MNTSDYKDAFLTEAREYLSTLNNSLIQLEKDPRQTEAIKEIFRAAHTLKGMSATMGYEPMAHLTHQMESVLEPIRSETKKLTSTLVDALFTCLDQLETWVKTLSTQETIGEERLGSLVQLLKDSAAGEPSAAPKPLQPVPMVSQDKPSSLPAFDASKMDVPFEFFDSENEVLSQAKMGGFSVLKVSVELEPDCAFKEVRAFMVLRNINEVGEIVKSHPSPEDIEKGNFPNQFHLVVVTDRPIEKLKDTLSKVSEVKAVTIEAFQPTGLSRPAAERAVAGVFKTRASDKAVPGAPAGDRPFAVPTVRVQTTKLDKLMALVQELVIAKIRFEQIVLSNQIKELVDPLSQLNHITDELQDEVMKVRLMPVKQIFERFPRMIRDLAKNLGKEVRLEMQGAEVELDRTVIEEMSEPLVHLLRNAVDHGLEAPGLRESEGKTPYGILKLEAKRERSYVLITVTDDGKGIDPEEVKHKCVAKGLISEEEAAKLTDSDAIRLIALPGFSTVAVASEISGRGVGVDVAKTKVESLGGSFKIQSRKGQGTTFTLKFPLTLAIIKVLLVKSRGEVFAIPVVNVIETIDILPTDKKWVQQQEVILLRGDALPVYRLTELLEIEPLAEAPEIPAYETVLIAEVGEARVGMLVDEILGQQEIAIKSLDKTLKGIRGYAGATILGDGKIALILDVASLIEDVKDKKTQAEHSTAAKGDSHAAQS